MSTIGPEDVAYVAQLARLALTEDEARAMARDLEQILGHVKSLDALDTEGVEPTAQCGVLEDGACLSSRLSQDVRAQTCPSP